MTQYKVVKFYQADRKAQVMRTGLTEAEAQKMCQDPETSSRTAKQPKGCYGNEAQIERWNEKKKHWFYGYTSY